MKSFFNGAMGCLGALVMLAIVGAAIFIGPSLYSAIAHRNDTTEEIVAREGPRFCADALVQSQNALPQLAGYRLGDASAEPRGDGSYSCALTPAGYIFFRPVCGHPDECAAVDRVATARHGVLVQRSGE